MEDELQALGAKKTCWKDYDPIYRWDYEDGEEYLNIAVQEHHETGPRGEYRVRRDLKDALEREQDERRSDRIRIAAMLAALANEAEHSDDPEDLLFLGRYIERFLSYHRYPDGPHRQQWLEEKRAGGRARWTEKEFHRKRFIQWLRERAAEMFKDDPDLSYRDASRQLADEAEKRELRNPAFLWRQRYMRPETVRQHIRGVKEHVLKSQS